MAKVRGSAKASAKDPAKASAKDPAKVSAEVTAPVPAKAKVSDLAMRIGFGWDSHAFKSGIPLLIGGVKLEYDKGLGGHSDGDVLLHAITDALLGAIAGPDIGTLFPPSDPQWKGADSVVFLQEALRRVQVAGYVVANLDSTLILNAPKIGPHAASIRSRVAGLLGIPGDCVGLKAKTPEGLNHDGAAMAHVVVLLQKRKKKN